MSRKGKIMNDEISNIKRSNRKAISPKKDAWVSHEEQQAQQKQGNFKKVKVTGLNLNEMLSKYGEEQANRNKGDKFEKSEDTNFLGKTSKQQQIEQSSRRRNPYYELYRSDLKYYGQYLQSCQKITQNGINYKWPYCFQSPSSM